MHINELSTDYSESEVREWFEIFATVSPLCESSTGSMRGPGPMIEKMYQMFKARMLLEMAEEGISRNP